MEIKNKIQYVPIHTLKNHPDNPRKVTGHQFDILCKSIQDNPEYFETRPIIVDKENVIWAGNMRFRAAQHNGLKEVPVVVLDLPKEKLKEIMVRDNVSAGTFDEALLAAHYEVPQLEAFGVNMAQFGVFGEEEPRESTKTQTSSCPHCGKKIKLSNRVKSIEKVEE